MERCEDFPCCGHEAGDCNGKLYGSDESIQAEVWKHEYCNHEAGYYWCEDQEDDEDDDEEPYVEEQCVHGLSLWLCADPVSHYPRDL